jgi:hypothetical protein
MSSGAFPVFVVAEKRFCIAAKIVETFLDPVDNPAAYWIPTGADDLRKEICEVLLEILPPTVFSAFSEAYAEPSEEGFRCVAKSAAFACDVMGHFRLRDTFSSGIEQMPKIAMGERNVVMGSGRRSAASINLFSFVAFMCEADALIEMTIRSPVRVVHDESLEFEAAFRFAHGLFVGSAALFGPYTLQSGRSPRLGVQYVTELRMDRSDLVPGLQGADALASLVRELGINENPDQNYRETGTLIRAAYFEGRARFDIIGSERFNRQFVGTMNPP